MPKANTINFGVVIVTSVLISGLIPMDNSKATWKYENTKVTKNNKSINYNIGLPRETKQYEVTLSGNRSNNGGVEMSNNLNNDTFKEYKEHTDTKFSVVNDKLDSLSVEIQNISDNMIRKDELLSEFKKQGVKKTIAITTGLISLWKLCEIGMSILRHIK